jgi:hypothetical protein
MNYPLLINRKANSDGLGGATRPLGESSHMDGASALDSKQRGDSPM